jgi:Fe-S-cluster containining protein
MPKTQLRTAGRKPPSSTTGRAKRPKTPVRRPANGHAEKAITRSPRSLPVVSQARTPIPCLSCGLCCSYVAVEIDGPSTLRAATDILWYLYHQNICIYVEDGEWMMQIEARCQHYQDDHKCGIYATRPQICREYDETTCEINAEEVGTVLYTTGEYLAYLEKHHKRIHTLLKKSYMPPADTLQGKSIGSRRVGPFRPRYEGLRARGLQ